MNELMSSPATDINVTPLFGMLERLSTSDAFDRETFLSLLNAHLAMIEGQKQAAYTRKMNAAQGEMRKVEARGRNPVFNSRYALHADLDDASRPIYTANGLAVGYGSILKKKYDPPVPAPQPHEQRFVLQISDVDTGYFEEIYLDYPKDSKPTGQRGPATTPAQNVNLLATYARKALLKMAFNLVEYASDDDGEHQRRPTKHKVSMDDWLNTLKMRMLAITDKQQLDALMEEDEVVRAIAYFATHPGTHAAFFQEQVVATETRLRLQSAPEESDKPQESE
jgi:hypothetical protein